MSDNIFYVYEHWRPDRDVCFYVGKGKTRRAGDMAARNRYHRNIQKKLSRLGMCVETRMVASGLTEDAAFALEIERIAFWRSVGVKLANKTDGGEGPSGWKMNPEQRKKISLTHLGRRKNAEWRRKIGDSNRGKIVSVESRQRMSLAQKNSKVPLEEKKRIAAAMGIAQKGTKRSAEVRARMSVAIRESHRVNPRSAEVRAKIGAAQRGVKRRPHSDETKAKMSISAKAWRAERRKPQKTEGQN